MRFASHHSTLSTPCSHVVVDVAVCSEADALLKEKVNKISGGANVLSGRVDQKQRKIKRSATIAAPTMSSALNAIDE